MIWFVIVRRTAKRDKGGHSIELPGAIEGSVVAPDRASALPAAIASVRAQGILGRVEVIAACSWRQMSNAERQRLLGDFTPPDETKEVKSLRRDAARDAARAARRAAVS